MDSRLQPLAEVYPEHLHCRQSKGGNDEGGLRDATKPFLFIFTLWIALAIAMLCALWPAGLPATSAIGSAFSPATTSVALRGRAEQVRPPAKMVKAEPEALDAPLTTVSHPAIPIRLPSLVSVPLAGTVTILFPVESIPAPAVAPAKPFHARGPPIA